MRQAFYIIGQYKDNHSILRRNYMMKRCLILVMSFFMLAGCTNFFGKEEVFEHISVLEQSFKEKELYWKKLQTDAEEDRKSTRLNSSHVSISYAVFCLKKKKKYNNQIDINSEECNN